MNQSNVTEDADVDVVHSEILEGARLSDVVEELGTVAGDARSLHDEVFGEKLAEALGIAKLVGADVVIVELLEDRQIFGGLLGVVNFVFLLCGSAFAAGELSFRCRVRGAGVRGCPVLFVSIRRAVLPTTSQSRSRLDALPP
nr:hypothetical protein [Kribbella sp. VKM Ac-2568]